MIEQQILLTMICFDDKAVIFHSLFLVFDFFPLCSLHPFNEKLSATFRFRDNYAFVFAVHPIREALAYNFFYIFRCLFA